MEFLRRHFEKLIFGFILVGLLVSVGLLMRSLTASSQKVVELKEAANRAPRSGGPMERVSEEESWKEPYRAINDPAVIVNIRGEVRGGEEEEGPPDPVPTLLEPGDYISCINPRCMNLIPYEADRCPFCGTEQPPIPGGPDRRHDQDGDGILDYFERQTMYLSPERFEDGQWDYDRDSFLNIEEFREKTALDDPTDHPPLAHNLRWMSFYRFPLPIVFRDASTYGNEDPAKWDLSFYIYEPGRRRPRSKYARVGETVGGFEIVEARMEQVTPSPAPQAEGAAEENGSGDEAEGNEETAPAPAPEPQPRVVVKAEDGETYTLVPEVRMFQREQYCNFIYLAARARQFFPQLPKSRNKVGDILTLPHLATRARERYEVVELKADPRNPVVRVRRVLDQPAAGEGEGEAEAPPAEPAKDDAGDEAGDAPLEFVIKQFNPRIRPEPPEGVPGNPEPQDLYLENPAAQHQAAGGGMMMGPGGGSGEMMMDPEMMRGSGYRRSPGSQMYRP